jgi:hypothetical protein
MFPPYPQAVVTRVKHAVVMDMSVGIKTISLAFKIALAGAIFLEL